jgi:anti-sigma-K factor RskA
MSDALPPNEERELLAAEYVLGLLEGEALLEARGLVRRDPAFAEAVAAWERRLAPMLDAIPEHAPPPELWPRIEKAIGAGEPAGGEVIQLRRHRNLWRTYAAAMTALAAALGFLLLFGPGRQPAPIVQPQPPPLLVASLAATDERTALTLVYDQGRRSLLVTPAQIASRPGRDHELWVVPASGTPLSLGLIRGGEASRVAIRPEIAALLRDRATVAVSVEPAGGSPTGRPTGPVVATAELRPV